MKIVIELVTKNESVKGLSIGCSKKYPMKIENNTITESTKTNSDILFLNDTFTTPSPNNSFTLIIIALLEFYRDFFKLLYLVNFNIVGIFNHNYITFTGPIYYSEN